MALIKGAGVSFIYKKNCKVPLITKTADYKEMLLDDIHAANIYNMIAAGKYGVKEFGDFVRALSGLIKKCELKLRGNIYNSVVGK